jgi:hypothetical protein
MINQNIKVVVVLMLNRKFLIIRTQKSNCAEENQNLQKVQLSKFDLKFWTSFTF